MGRAETAAWWKEGGIIKSHSRGLHTEETVYSDDVQINVVKGCTINTATHSTFDPVYLDSRVFKYHTLPPNNKATHPHFLFHCHVKILTTQTAHISSSGQVRFSWDCSQPWQEKRRKEVLRAIKMRHHRHKSFRFVIMTDSPTYSHSDPSSSL